MDYWLISIYIFIGLITVSGIPIVFAILRKVKLNPGGNSFEECTCFSDDSKLRLESHFSRMQGTLVFWKNKAELYKFLHYYFLIWSTVIITTVPIILQFITKENYSSIFLTVISTFSAIFMGLHKLLKVQYNYRDFRLGESEFYDLYRKLLDQPHLFGIDEESQINSYFSQVEQIRKKIRDLETDNSPTLQ